MTEDEAKTKWCPMIRIGHVAGMSVNVNFEERNDRAHAACIASACMMWRWHAAPKRVSKDNDVPVEMAKTGYCGLAGAHV